MGNCLNSFLWMKHQNGDDPTKSFCDLSEIVGVTTIERLCKMIDEIGSINLTASPGPPRTMWAKEAIEKVKNKLQKDRISTRKLELELAMSRRSAPGILREDLGCRSYKYLIEPALTDEHIDNELVWMKLIFLTLTLFFSQ